MFFQAVNHRKGKLIERSKLFFGDMERCNVVLLCKLHCSALASVREAENYLSRELLVPDRIKKRLEIAAVAGAKDCDAGLVASHIGNGVIS